jgi:hypothetical protein
MTESAPTRYRLRVILIGSEPEIWRLLEVDGGLRLDELHDVLQIAFGWRNSHLHQFMEENPYERPLPRIGRAPLHWSMPDPEDDEPGLPESEWTIAAVFDRLSGPLYYEYDFGDGWIHSIEAIRSEPAGADEPRARLLDGKNRGPIDDSGGVGGYQELLEALADPAHPEHEHLSGWVAGALPWEHFDPTSLDVEQVNCEFALRFDAPDAAPTTVLDGLLERLPASLARELRSYARRVGALEPPVIDADTAARMARPYLWLLRRVGPDGLALTQAGWLPPAVVSDATRELGWEDRWIGKHNREDQTPPIRYLRESAQRLGLLRKLKGRLLHSVAAKRMLDDPVALWWHLARSIAPRARSAAEHDAAILQAIEVASARHENSEDYTEPILFGMDALGWVRPNGSSLDEWDLNDIVRNSRSVLECLGVFEADRWRFDRVTEGGRAFARAMLQA